MATTELHSYCKKQPVSKETVVLMCRQETCGSLLQGKEKNNKIYRNSKRKFENDTG